LNVRNPLNVCVKKAQIELKYFDQAEVYSLIGLLCFILMNPFVFLIFNLAEFYLAFI